jgi:hypothetical protein
MAGRKAFLQTEAEICAALYDEEDSPYSSEDGEFFIFNHWDKYISQ